MASSITKMDKRLLLEATQQSIDELARSFQTNRFDYLSESDIKIELVSILKKRLNQSILNDDPRRSPIHVVKSEYPYPNQNRQKIDVAILDPQPKNQSSTLWTLPIFAAIELKYSIDTNKNKSFLSDIQKLQSIKDCHLIALHFSLFEIKYSFKMLQSIKLLNDNNFFVITLDKIYQFTNSQGTK